MAQVAVRGTGGQTWHNHLPAWIPPHPEYARLTPAYRAVLQALANACDAADAQGHLLGGCGGQRIWHAAGVSRATFWRAVRTLTAAGFVVLVARGGVLAGRNCVSRYAVPGAPGALDHVACRRRVQRMVSDGAGKWVPQIITPGDQPQLLDVQPRAATNAQPPTPPAQGPARAAAPVPPAPRATASVAGRALQGLKADDLHSLSRLQALFRRAVAARLVAGSESGWFDFVGAAVHARRVADRNPAGLFASIVRRGQWLYITAADEEAARRWIRGIRRQMEDPLDEVEADWTGDE